jgi:hypothetical protein
MKVLDHPFHPKLELNMDTNMKLRRFGKCPQSTMFAIYAVEHPIHLLDRA